LQYNDEFLDDFSRDGIDWNAFTDNDKIFFQFTGLESKLCKYRDLVLEKLSVFNINEEDFNKEKKIVIEEYHDCFNSQIYAHYLNLTRKLHNNYEPIGELSDLERITLADCQKYFEVQFKHPSLIINISKTCIYEIRICIC
jgi:predicted Zn-dependent peptidase